MQLQEKRDEGVARDEAAPSMDRLVACRRRAISWVTDHLSDFEPANRDEFSIRDFKSIAELTIVLVRLLESNTVRDPAFARSEAIALRNWKAFVIETCSSSRYRDALERSPHDVAVVVFPYVLLRAIGVRMRRCEAAVARLTALGFPDSIEMVPHRELDRRYFYWRAGLLRREPDWKSLYRRTALARMKSVLHVDLWTAYAITHTIFYLGRFGNDRCIGSCASAIRMARIVDSLLIHYCRIGNWDLVGELLIDAASLPDVDRTIYATCFERFCRTWEDDGSHGPDAAPIEPAPADDRSAPVDRFGQVYHTTLVGILACESGLADDRHATRQAGSRRRS